MELGDEATHSTVIHDSVIARTSLSVEKAIDLEPDSLDASDNFGLTPLQWAVLRNNVHGTGVLLSWHPNLELCDYDKRSALHRAAEFDLAEIAQMLVNAGANVDVMDAWGDTPLHLAITLSSHRMARLLLASGARILPNRYGRTPLHGSVFGRFPEDAAVLEETVSILLDAGADFDGVDAEGMTPIVVAIQRSQVAMFHVLRRRGAMLESLEPSAVNGKTIYHIAAMFSTHDMVQALRGAGITGIDPCQVDAAGLTALERISQRVSLPEAELSEGQVRASKEEYETFKALIEEARLRYYHKEDATRDGDSSDEEGFSDAVEFQDAPEALLS